MSLPRYPEYKDSGVRWLGSVPAHWPVLRLRRCVVLNPSKGEVAMLPRTSDVSFIPMDAVGDDGRLNLERSRPLGEVESGYTYFRDGDVTFAKITPCFENGKGALMRGLLGGIGFGTTELTVARPVEDRMTAGYLDWLFRSAAFRNEGEASMYGAGGQKRVPDDFVRQLLWGLPSLAEQRAIVSFLDRETAKIDALIAEQEKLLALLAEKRQATISRAVTRGLDPGVTMKDSGVQWLGAIPAHWVVDRFKASVEFAKNGVWGGDAAGDADDIACVRVADFDRRSLVVRTDIPTIRNITASERSGRLLTKGDLLLEKSGGGDTQLVGQVVLYDRQEPAVCSNFVARVKLREGMDARFWRYVHAAAYAMRLNFRAIKQTSGIQNLDQDQYFDERAPFPPTSEQVAIADYLDAVTEAFDRLEDQARQGIDLLQERRSALISAAVTGQIDVRGITMNHSDPTPEDITA